MAGKIQKRKPGKRIGRPTVYTEEKAATICRRIAGGASLRVAAKAVGVTGETVRKWLLERNNFSAQYARAREEQADHFADEILEIADAAQLLSTSEEIQAARLRVDSRKWAAAHLRPKKWGDRLIHAGDPDAPVEVQGDLNLRGEWSDIIRSSREDRELSGAATDIVG